MGDTEGEGEREAALSVCSAPAGTAASAQDSAERAQQRGHLEF